MLHPDFLTRPIAHRGLHGPGVPENAIAAFAAAVDRGYGIELDVQPALDGTPLVFHDENILRMTGVDRPVAALTVTGAGSQRLLGTDQTIPTLRQVLDMVAGRVPVLIEIKNQDGALGPEMGDLPARVAEVVRPHAAGGQPVAVMSFNPHAVRAVHSAGAAIALGLTSCAFRAHDWPGIPEGRRVALARLEDFATAGATFVSHDRRDLANPAVRRLASRGVPVLCWTIRSAAQEAAARRLARNITFEGYLP